MRRPPPRSDGIPCEAGPWSDRGATRSKLGRLRMTTPHRPRVPALRASLPRGLVAAALSVALHATGCTGSGGEGGGGEAVEAATPAADATTGVDAPDGAAGADATLSPDATGDGAADAPQDATAQVDAEGGIVGEAGIPGEADVGPEGDVDDAGFEGATSSADAAADADANDCALGPAGEAVDLRCAGLYTDWPPTTLAPSTREYDPGLHLWSDGANKTRWVQLPEGGTIDTSDMDEWIFPVGTRFWKDFVVGGKRIETRLIWKYGIGAWYATTYLWSADGSSAVELTQGELNADGNGYEVPAQFQCRACHVGRVDFVLGFEAVSLSSSGASGVTIQTLVSEGLISAAPTSPIVIPGTPIEAAALGYLHANCGTACHNRVSPMDNKDFYMSLSVADLGSVQATDTFVTGWNVPTVDFPGSAGTPIRIAACDTVSSSVYYRMNRRDPPGNTGPLTQMPPIDSHKIDDAGVAIIGAWIDEKCADAGFDADAAPDAPDGD
jgi:hypothetical protein